MLKKFIQTALLLVVLCTTATTYAQVSQAPDGIQFQALATDANGHPAAGRVIYVKDAIVAKTATGTIVYSETFKVTASSAGIFTIVLGKGTYASGVSSIANIDWANGPFFLNLKIAVEPTVPTASWNVNNEYVDLGTSQFWSVPYAIYAGNVKGADTKLNISDTAAMLKPYFTAINLKANIESPTFTGTVSGITKAMVGLGNVDNTADINKPVSTATQTALDLKANAADVTTALALKANATDVTNALVLKANTTDVTTALDLKVDKVTGKALSTNDYTTAEKAKLAAITGTNTGDQDLSALAVAADVTTALALKANTADVNAALALKANGASVASSINTINTTLNTKANTIDVNNALMAKADVVAVNNAVAALNASLVTKADNIAVTNQLGTKEDKLNKSVNVTTDAASDTKYPSVKAIKTYVDAQVAGATIADANTTTKGKIQLAGDLAGTAAAPTVPGLALKENLSNKSTDVTTDAASDTKYPSVKSVKTYVDAQVAGATIADASATEKGKIQLAGDLAGTAAAPTVPGLALKAPIASPIFTGTVTTGAINTGTLSSTSITAPTYASTPIALTYSGSNINWNPAQGLNAAITLTQNSGLNFTAAPPVGSYGTVVLTQDATGSRTITLPTIAGATNKVLGSTSTSTVALSTVANSKDILNFYFDGTSCYWNIGQGYGAAATTGTTNLATSVNGTLAVANGGTGATTASAALTSLGAAPLASPTFTGTVSTGALSSTSITAPTYASTPIALTYSGSNINWNPAQGLNAAITLTQNSGLNFTAAPPVGSYGTVVLTQDATGSRTITLPTIAGATNKVLGSTSTSTVALSTVANSKDILNFYFDGTSCYWNIGQGYGAAATTGTTNLATSVNGTLAVANGGTGANSLTGLVKGNGSSALTAAVAGTDYQAPLTLTTTGTGAATLVGSTLNIPTVTAVTSTNASTLTGTVAIANGGTGVTTVAGIKAVLGYNLSKIAMGDQAGQTNQADYAIALGGGAGTTNQSVGAIAIGGAAGSTNQGSSSVGIGSNAAQAGQGEQAVAIGFAAGQNNQAAKSVAIGAYAGAGHVNSSAIGYQAVTTSPNTIQLGADGVTVSGSTAITNVRTSGSLTAGAVTYPNTNGTAGQVLTANNNGNASWANPASSGVPYTGATGAVNLGAYDLTVNGLIVGKGKKDAGTAYQYNTALGVSALNSFTGGTKNTALGYNALSGVTSTDQNIAIGTYAMGSTTDYFQQSVAVGNQTLQYNKGSFNTALGSNALSSSNLTSAATYLVGVGALALWNNTSGQNNTAVGSYALAANTTGNNNTALGQGADVTTANLSNATAIGYDAKVSTSNTIQLGNTSVTNVKTSGAITAPIYASTPQPLTAGSTINWNPSLGLNASVTLNQNSTINFSSIPTSGAYGTLVVTQDGTGSRTLTLPSSVTNKILGSTSNTTIGLSSAANAIDIINFYFDGTNYFWNVGQGYGSASSLTATNIAGGAAGSIPYQTASGATSLLAKGTDGQILTLASGIPSWSAAPVTGVSTATSPLSISGTTISLGTVPVANGGTGATSASAALTSLGAAPLASPTFTGTPAAPTATAGTNTTQIATTAFVANAVKITTGLNSDEFTVTTQTGATATFTLTQTALNAKVFMFINGTRIKNGAFSVSGTTVTYTAANNNSYALVAGDRIQFDYAY